MQSPAPSPAATAPAPAPASGASGGGGALRGRALAISLVNEYGAPLQIPSARRKVRGAVPPRVSCPCDARGFKLARAACLATAGAAWVTQDDERIGRLFTEDAAYVERPHDERGTFRGREAIRAYWRRQIQGKQRDIKFHQVKSPEFV